MDNRSQLFLTPLNECFIKQVKEWGEIIIGIENKNKYEIFDDGERKIGYAAEIGSGFFKFISRNILRSHRPMELKIWDLERREIFSIKRPFYWFFSELAVFDASGEKIGVAHRKFAFFTKKYELHDALGRMFAKIKSPIWRLWTFPILDLYGKDWGLITKKWGGVLREVFTDADTFKVEFPALIDESKKAIILATAFTIDLDYFEDNNRSRSHMSWNN